MEQETNNNNNNNRPNLADTDLFKFVNKNKFWIIGALAFFLLGFSSYYTVDANEKAVILRLGKYHDTKDPGLHFKIPLVDSVEIVKTGFLYKEEFGYQSESSKNLDTTTQDSTATQENISLMITNDPSIVEVTWAVQYRISDPRLYLFNVKNVENTIRDVSEAAMRLQIGDNNFNDILYNRDKLTLEQDVQLFMQNSLGNDGYKTGIDISTVKIISARYPDAVASAFDDVFKAKKDRDISITEAETYQISVLEEARGEVALFDSMAVIYEKYPTITRANLYYEFNEYVANSVKEILFFGPNTSNNFLPHKDVK
tara:strand:- start:163 stop:1101 length:939 start_codon:yes stop_codon:yes gene_type:complete